MRILAVDPGEKRIGLATSDQTGMIARPYSVIRHLQREKDATQVVQIAQDLNVDLIIVGQNIDSEGVPTLSGRKAVHLADSIRGITKIPVILWDETGSTQTARKLRIEMQTSRKSRSGHLDDLTAAVILQDYLDSHF